MTVRLLPAELHRTERKLRLLAILDACRHVGLAPASISTVHGIAYLADALAPVWHLPILDGQMLKRRRRLFFPSLQGDLDGLVGHGVVRVTRLTYRHSDGERGWALDADFELVPEFAGRILDAASRFELQARKLRFVREVVFAASGLGVAGIANIGQLDAAYSSSVVDVGGVLDIEPGSGELNATAEVALRFADLIRDDRILSDAELVHLYVRHLYSRMLHVA